MVKTRRGLICFDGKTIWEGSLALGSQEVLSKVTEEDDHGRKSRGQKLRSNYYFISFLRFQ